MNGSNASPLATALNIFTSPSEAFAAIEQRPTWLFPLLTIIVAFSAVIAWYFTIVDFDWYVDQIASTLNVREQQAAADGMRMMGSGGMMASALGGIIFGFPIVFALYAGYLRLVSHILGDDTSFRKWFSLSVWTYLVYLVSVLALAVVVFLNPEGRIDIEAANPLSLNNLLGTEPGDTFHSLAKAVDLVMLWHFALMVLGYRQWLSASTGQACAVILGPAVVIYGIWFLVLVI